MPAPYADRAAVTAWLAGGDYEDQLPPAPEGEAADPLDRVIARAWECINDHSFGMYEVDSGTGDPVDDEGAPDTVTITALTDAVCAQIEQWYEVGEENDIAGFPGDTFMSAGVSVNRLPSVLAPRAARILRRAGIIADVPPRDAPVGVTLV